MSTKRQGFTLIELVVAVTLFAMAMSIALFATVGTNGLLQRTETRGSILEGSRDSIDAIRRATVGSLTRDISIVTGVSYASADNDLNPNVTISPQNSDATGFATQIKKYGTSQRDNVCYLIGRGAVTKAANNALLYRFQADGSQVLQLVFKMNATNLCEYSTILYRGALTNDNLQIKQFGLLLKPVNYSCSGVTCTLSQLRYRLALEEKALKDKTKSRPSIETSGSVPILLEQKNVATAIVGIVLRPLGPLELKTGEKMKDPFTVDAVFGDSSTTNVSSQAVYSATGGSLDSSHTYTAGSIPGNYLVTATYGGFQDTTNVTIIEDKGNTKTLQSLTLSPASVCVQPGGSTSFTVIGNYSDKSVTNLTGNVAYTLKTPAHGTMLLNTFTALVLGTDQLTASYQSVTSNTATIQIQLVCGIVDID